MSQSQPPRPEITLDLDGGPRSVDERRRRSIPNAALAFAAILVLVVAGAITVGQIVGARTPVAEATVRAFLEASRSGDVAAAMALSSGDRSGESLLRPEALDDRWRIRTVAQVEYRTDSRRDVDAEAVVYAEIEAFDGTRVGHRFTVFVDGDQGVIDEGTTVVELFLVDTERIEFNDLSFEVDELTYEPLLPGLYEFYRSGPPTLDMQMPPVLVLGDAFIELGADHTTPWLDPPLPVPSEAGLAIVDDLVHDLLRDCEADHDAQWCPFGLPADERISPLEGARWTVTEDPRVAVDGYDDPMTGFGLTAAVPGTAVIDVLVREDGRTREATLGCAVRLDGLKAVFDFDGGVSLDAGDSSGEPCVGMVEL